MRHFANKLRTGYFLVQGKIVLLQKDILLQVGISFKVKKNWYYEKSIGICLLCATRNTVPSHVIRYI